MSYTVSYEKRVFKDLDGIPDPDARRIQERFHELAHAPFPSGVQKLAGENGMFRLRQGNYRILYTVDHGRKRSGCTLWATAAKFIEVCSFPKIFVDTE